MWMALKLFMSREGVNKFQPIKNFTHYEWVKKKLNEKFIFTRDESGNCCFCR